MRGLDVRVYEGLYVVQLGCKPRCRADVCVEPSLYELDLIAEMDGGGAEGGRVEGGFFDYYWATGCQNLKYTWGDVVSSYIRFSGFATGSSAGGAFSSAMLFAYRNTIGSKTGISIEC
jgi:hypothetical protein